MKRLVLLSLLLTGCVPKAKHNRELDAVRTERANTQTQLELLQNRLQNAEASLAAEADVNKELSGRLANLDQNNKALREQLERVGAELAALGTRSATQAKQKQSLEEMVARLQTDAASAQQEAEQAAQRAAELDAERQRLADEAARLAAEKAALEATTAEYDKLVDELKGEIESGQVTITELSGKLTVNMSNAILFDSGSTSVKKAGRDALSKVAGVLTGIADREIRVEGHTDNVPVNRGAPYPDNWALSALRASGVVELLVAGGVDPLNIAAVGYGEHRPTESNDTREGRAANRRTEIVLVPRLD